MAARELFQHRFRRACGRFVSSGYRRDITGKQAKTETKRKGKRHESTIGFFFT